jgi:hypothetical protein
MLPGVPNSELTPGQKSARRRKVRSFGGLLFFLLGLPPLINAMDNPRIATLRGPDVLGLFAIGFCFGGGLALLLVGLIFRGE